VACVVSVQGHDKMTIPYPRVYSESQTPNCGAGTGSLQTATVTVASGGSLQVGWDGNHSGGSVTVSLVFADPNPSSTALQNGYLINPATNTINWPYPQPNLTTVPIPNDLPSGVYTLRWAWAGWYTCAEINVQGSGSVADSPLGSTISANSGVNNTLFYRVAIQPNNNVFLVVNGPPSITFAAAGGLIPSLTAYDTLAVGTGSPYGLSVCGDTQGGSSSAFVGVFSNVTAAFTITSSEYNSFLDITQTAPQIVDSLSVAGNKFYYTAAYDTPDKPKRVVLEKTSGSGTVGLSRRTTCDTALTPDESGDSFACFDLGTPQGIKYVQVTGTEAMNYNLGLEIGTCADRKPSSSSAASLVFSIAISVACLLFVL